MTERLRRAAVEGASTSLILCGHSGCGKHATLARALDRLDADPAVPRYDVAELNGLVHAEAAAGLRELAAQLDASGDVSEKSRYVDDLGLLVDELRRRRAERRAPLLVVLSELDAFALQPRQTLLYVLLDAMQSRLGCVGRPRLVILLRDLAVSMGSRPRRRYDVDIHRIVRGKTGRRRGDDLLGGRRRGGGVAAAPRRRTLGRRGRGGAAATTSRDGAVAAAPRRRTLGTARSRRRRPLSGRARARPRRIGGLCRSSWRA